MFQVKHLLLPTYDQGHPLAPGLLQCMLAAKSVLEVTQSGGQMITWGKNQYRSGPLKT